jgi:hypothetical protein
VAEPEVAAALERQFDTGWFPDHDRCSIDTDDAVVYVDFDPAHVGRLTPDERRSLVAQLGFPPAAAIHVTASTHYPGSSDLAKHVLLTLGRLLGGRSVAA